VWRSAISNLDISKSRFMSKWVNWEGFSQEGLDLPEEHQCLPKRTIKFLSYNIQAGMSSGSYTDYVRNGIKQMFPVPDYDHLDKIADILSSFDIVMLQEVDCGSLRSGFINQLEYLASGGDFDFFHQQLNRNVGKFGQFSNGLLSRFSPLSVENHRLPGLKGRGAIIARYALPPRLTLDEESSISENVIYANKRKEQVDELIIVGLHLALGGRTRAKQLDYVMDLVKDEPYVVIMGDLNCCEHSATTTALGYSELSHVNFGMETFPSWAPKKCIDHIWVSEALDVKTVEVLPHQLSDHRPLTAHINLGE